MANYTILLIDYEPRSIERFRDPLVSGGYAVEIATDGVSGIEAFHRLSPDMVLVEAMIPKKHGFEVCQELKRTPHGRRTPILITTGVYKGRKYRTQALHIYGCDEYIEKPIAPEQLLEVVGKFFVTPAVASSARAAQPATSTESVGARVASSGESTSAQGSPGKDASAPSDDRSEPTLVTKPLANDEGEDEIMARLDAILPTSAGASPRTDPQGVSNLATFEASAKTIEEDPFAQMRAELDAELGPLSAALAIDPAASAEPFPDPIPSDQISTPPLMEALPAPDLAPAPQQPGRVVNFDTKRPRKGKKSARQAKGSPAATTFATSSPGAPPKTPAPTGTVTEMKLPAGTVVASELDAPKPRRAMPFWAWAVVAVGAVVAVYFGFFQTDGPTASRGPAPSQPVERAEAPATPVTEHVDANPSIAAQVPSPASSAPASITTVPASTEPVPPGPAPEQRRPTPTPQKVAAPPPAPSPKKNTDRATPAAVAAKPAGPPATIANWKSKTAAPAGSSHVEAPTGLGDSVTGVESVPDATLVTAPTVIAPGTLMAVDDVDAMPESLMRKPPTYSLRAREMKLSGTIVMNVLVNEHGTVDQVVLVTGIPGADLNESAIRAAKSWTYRPATKNQVPVKVWKSEQVVFKQ
jgi:TonB family protein